jgi:hypothetical protein
MSPIRLLLAVVFLAAAILPSQANMRFEELSERVKNQLVEMSRICTLVGGRPGDPLRAIEFFDLDDDGTPDIIYDESRLACAGVAPGAWCDAIGCRTYVTLSQRGSWRPAFDVVGSYCIDHSNAPPRFVTIQRNYSVDGTMTILNVRYRFRRGMAFQDGRGTC